MPALGACRVFVVAGIVVACWTADASAQWPCSPINNLPICTAADAQTTPSIDADGSGGAVFTWADRRNGTDYDVYVQRVDALGNLLWTSQGVAVCTAGGSQTEPKILSDGAGGAFITWTDGRGANTDIYAQRVNAAGVPQWTPNGVGVCVGGNAQHLPVEASDGAGGVIICWNDQTSGTSLGIFAQRLDGSGAAIWTPNGVQVSPIASAGTSVPKIIADGSGGAVVVWAYGFPEDLNAQRINSAGAPQWGTNGIVVSNATNGQNGPNLYPDGAGGAFIVWNDFRNTSSGEDVYGQRVNGAGTPQWTANGMPIAVAGDIQGLPVLTTDGAGGVLVAWQDRRNPGSQDIYGQRLNSAGTALWAANGQSLCGGGSVSRYALSIASDGAGGAVVAWDQATGTFDIYAERVNSGGADLWNSAGIAVSTATDAQRFPLVVAAGGGASIVCWTDSRPGSSQTDIFAQRLRADGTLGGSVVDTFTIAASAGANGSISPSGAVSATCGGSQTFFITPNSCYSVASVLVDGSSVGAVTTYTFTNIQANHTISASFALKTYTITATQSTQGQIIPSGNVSVSCGASREFDIIPYAPYFLTDVLIDGNSVGAVSTYTFLNVQSNHTIQPVFSTVLVYGDPNAFTVHPNLITTTCYATPESCLVTIVGSAGAITMNNSVVQPARVIAENPSRDFEEEFVDSSAVAPSLIQLMQTSARMAQIETTFVGPAGGVIDFTHPTKMRFRPTYSTSPDDSLIAAQVVDQQDASPLGLVFYKVESDSAYFVNIISPDSMAFFTHDSLIAVVRQDSTKVRVTFVCGPRDTAGLSVSGGAGDRADPARFGKFKKQFAKLTGKVEKFFEKTKMCIRREEPFCCLGTLGSLVTDGTSQYILSNNHVLARLNKGVAGEPIEQPGTLDVNCSPSPSEYVANLTRFLPLDFAPTDSNVVDCAIAQVIPGQVDPSGAILDIGQISDQIISSPSLGLSVKKSGRTTGLTTGTVTGLNATIPIRYAVSCGSSDSVTANFVHQVKFSGMSDHGDSGSLIVENVASCPRPVALLFAGSASTTFGNPIDSVLVRLGVSFVHGSCPAPFGSTRGTESDQGLSHAMDVQNTNTARLLRVPGVAGTAVGKDESGRWVIQILVERDTPELRAQLPTSLGDFPTRLVETGVIEAY